MFKHYIFKLKYVFAFLLFAVSITFLGEGNLLVRFEQKQEISKLQGEIDEYQRKFDSDRTVLNSLKNDPDALREVAREKYYMKTENEDIFIIEDED